ncbi:SigE family RNA polymerase sigma factor [Nocardioides sp. NBC_00368]|uniref:SigE family RNA polymerase sigma factor n=1 Tax=Nocardioides sp. NBC_00368 TaxID=2976000 RepID=UPI002E1B5A63
MDEDEFDALYNASYRRLCAQLYAMIGDFDEAAECVQEAFARAWAHRRKMSSVDYPEAWVRTTAYRLAVGRWRRKKYAGRAADRAVGARTEMPGVDESHVALVAALKKLPEAQRQAIVLHHIADLPVHQVAAEVGAPTGTIKARLARGRAALAELLAEDNPGAGAVWKEA